MQRRRTNERRERSAAHFATRLADILHQLRVTHQELAHALGIKRYTVDSWTRATNPSLPSADNLERLCLWLETREHGLSKQVVAAVTTALPVQAPLLNAESHGKLRAAETHFVGREGAIDTLHTLLRHHRLVTLTGAGGIGKTRLALRVCEALALEFEAGAVVVELASISHPDLLFHAIGHALRLYESGGRHMHQLVLDALRDLHLLLLLDNCEHLLADCAMLCQELLSHCPQLTILATSRERLHLSTEKVWETPAMDFPAEFAALTRRQIMAAEAPRLFAQRALWARRNVQWNDESAALVAALCRRLDGIPLAIEMAAAWMGSLELAEIAERLNLEFLVAPEPGSVARHRTMRAVIDWSYRLLDADAQTLLARLAVFPGGWSAEAAIQVCADGDAGNSLALADIPFLLQTLVNKSLVQVEASEGRIIRYRVLETTRQFAWEKLVANGEPDHWRRRQCDYYLAKTQEADASIRGSQTMEWLTWFAWERDNLRTVIDWAFADPTTRTQGAQIAAAMDTFWWMRGEFSEGRQYLETIITEAALPIAVQIRVLRALGVLCWAQGDLPAARPVLEEAIRLALLDHNPYNAGWSLHCLQMLLLQQGEFASVEARSDQVEELFMRCEDGVGIGMTLVARATAIMRQGRNDEAAAIIRSAYEILIAEADAIGIAEALTVWGIIDDFRQDLASMQQHYEEALPHLQAIDNRMGISHLINNLGVLAFRREAYAQAADYFLQSAEIDRGMGHRWWYAFKLINLAAALIRQGEHGLAATHLQRAVAYFASQDDANSRRKIADALLSLAKVAGSPAMSITLLAASKAAYDATGLPWQAIDLAEFEESVAHFRAALSNESFDAAYAHGASLSLEEIVTLVMGLP